MEMKVRVILSEAKDLRFSTLPSGDTETQVLRVAQDDKCLTVLMLFDFASFHLEKSC